MSLVIKNETHVPPGGNYIARCDCPLCINSPHRFEASSHHVDGVVGKFHEHFRGNGMAELSREAIVQLICRDTPANICQGDDYQYKERRLGWGEVVNGTKVLASFIAGGRQTVSQELANERAVICANCPENVLYAKNCSTCTHVEDTVRTVIGDKGTPLDGRLHACFICGCSNRAQVWIRPEDLAKGVNDHIMERFSAVKECWKAKEIKAL